MKTKIILITIIVLVAVVIAIALTTGPEKQNTTNDNDNDNVNDNVNNSGDNSNESLKNVEIAKEIYGFSAVIKNIDDKTLTLEGSVPAINGEILTLTVKTLANDTTKVVKLKFPAVVEDKTKPIYPEEITLKFSDLKVGDKINISCVENIAENIKNDKPIIINNIFVTGQ